MKPLLSWQTRAFSSFLHGLRNPGHLDSLIGTEFRETAPVIAARIDRLLTELGQEPGRFWIRLATTTALQDDLLPAVRLALGVESSETIDEELLEGLRRLRQSAAPGETLLEQDLHFRQRPISMQWQARGPGLLKHFGATTSLRLPSNCQVVLVEPSTKGGVQPIPDLGAVVFEALLTDIHHGLPEVLRLAWGVCQLATGRNETQPSRKPTSPADSLDALGLLPPLLQSAEHVEFASYSAQSIELAISAWEIPTDGFPGQWTDRQIAERLFEWWRDSTDSSTAWLQAISKLR